MKGQHASAVVTELVLFEICVGYTVGEEHHASRLNAVLQMEDMSEFVNSFFPCSLKKKNPIVL